MYCDLMRCRFPDFEEAEKPTKKKIITADKTILRKWKEIKNKEELKATLKPETAYTKCTGCGNEIKKEEGTKADVKGEYLCLNCSGDD